MIFWTLWKRTFRDAMWLLLGCAVVMFIFQWVFVWLTSLVPSSSFLEVMQELPTELQGMTGMTLQQAASPTGRIAMGYVDPTVILIASLWAIARGSDAVSGPLDRGTLEMLLAQPVNRAHWLLAHASVTLIGCVVLGVTLWAGTYVGVQIVEVEVTRYWVLKSMVPLTDVVEPRQFVPSAINTVALAICTAGLATLVSSLDRYRWRTVGIMGGFCLLQVVIKVVALGSPDHGWLYYLTFYGAYWPQKMAVAPEAAWGMLLQYGGLLTLLGLVSMAAAAVCFSKRDLPAPL